MKKDKYFCAIVMVCLAILAGTQISMAQSIKAIKHPKTLPTYAQIHTHKCETNRCKNKADVFLVVDFGIEQMQNSKTYLCNECYTNCVVKMAAPIKEITINGDGGRIKR